MRVTNICGRELKLRANLLALTYYRQEFGKELLDDFKNLTELAKAFDGYKKDPKNFSFEDLRLNDMFQLAYALNKASVPPSEHFPSFLEWQYDMEVDITELEWYEAVIEETLNGFFRTGKPSKPKQEAGKQEPKA